jgi:hypothetical protein
LPRSRNACASCWQISAHRKGPSSRTGLRFHPDRFRRQPW